MAIAIRISAFFTCCGINKACPFQLRHIDFSYGLTAHWNLVHTPCCGKFDLEIHVKMIFMAIFTRFQHKIWDPSVLMWRCGNTMTFERDVVLATCSHISHLVEVIRCSAQLTAKSKGFVIIHIIEECSRIQGACLP